VKPEGEKGEFKELCSGNLTTYRMGKQHGCLARFLKLIFIILFFKILKMIEARIFKDKQEQYSRLQKRIKNYGEIPVEILIK